MNEPNFHFLFAANELVILKFEIKILSFLWEVGNCQFFNIYISNNLNAQLYK